MYFNWPGTVRITFMFQLDKMHCNSAIDSNPIEIENYFPIKSSEAAIAFCENKDGLLDQRKKALMRWVYGASDISNMSNFVASVGDIFFHHSYQVSHRWPSKQ